MPINYISKVKATDGSTYMIKDSHVWGNNNPETWVNNHSTQSLADVVENLYTYSDFLGVTTSAVTDGSTNAQVVINNSTVTAQKGNIVLKDSKEFIWNGSSWSEFGDLSAITSQLGDLAYKDNASTTYKPAGTVSQPSFNGTAATITAKGTPAGTVSKPSFTGTAATISAKGTPAGTVSKPTFTGTAATISAKGTPAGTVSKPTFSGTAATISVVGTPTGSVSKPNVTVTNSTKTIQYVTGRGTLPTLTVQTNNTDSQMLEFVFTQGALCSTASINATTNVTAALAAVPTFTGNALTSTATYTPAGTVSQPTFSGATLTATAAYTPGGSVSQPTFSGAVLTSTAAYTPGGNVSQPTFSGAELSATAAYTPAGTVTKPTFTGTQATITVS